MNATPSLKEMLNMKSIEKHKAIFPNKVDIATGSGKFFIIDSKRSPGKQLLLITAGDSKGDLEIAEHIMMIINTTVDVINQIDTEVAVEEKRN